MPFADVSAISCVATRSGWQPLVVLTEPRLLVINRFGTLVEVPVEISSGGTGTTAFLGSRTAFGPFANETLVLEDNGNICRVGALINVGDVRSHNYETIIGSTVRAFYGASEHAVWHGLRSLACVASDEEVVVRCVESSALVPTRLKSVIRVGVRYLVIPRAELVAGVRSDWCAFVRELCRALFLREEEGRLEIPTASHVLGLWYASALAATGDGFRFSFDTIQHSSYLFVHHEADIVTGTSAGATAFRRSVAQNVLRLSWTDSSSNPLVNGFILAGR